MRNIYGSATRVISLLGMTWEATGSGIDLWRASRRTCSTPPEVAFAWHMTPARWPPSS